MGDTIEEIPIEESEEVVVEAPATHPPIRPKAKGRPKGALNKPKPKKVVVRPVSPPASPESSSSEDEPPQPTRKRKPRADTVGNPQYSYDNIGSVANVVESTR